MEQWIYDNIIWIMTAAFGAGGFAFLLRQLSNQLSNHEKRMAFRFDEHEARIERRFDKLDANDASHDSAISDLQSRMARQEERTEVLSEMRAQIADIWKHSVRNNARN